MSNETDYNQLNQQLDKAIEKLKELNKQSQSTQKEISSLQSEIRSLSSGFSSASSTLSNLSSTMSSFNKESSTAKTNFKNLDAASITAKNSFGEVKEQIQGVNSQLDQSKIKIAEYNEAVSTIRPIPDTSVTAGTTSQTAVPDTNLSAMNNSNISSIANTFDVIASSSSVATSAVNNLSNCFKNNASATDIAQVGLQSFSDILSAAATGGPLAIGTMAVSGLISVLAQVAPIVQEQLDPIGSLTEKTLEAKAAFDQFQASQDQKLKSDLVNIDYTKKLSDELKTLIDENGNVKTGYEDRVKFIYDKLKPAVGDAIQWNNDEKTSLTYNADEIERIISLKRAQLILDKKERSASEAMDNLDEAQSNYNTSLAEYQKKKEEYETAYNSFIESGGKNGDQNPHLADLKTAMDQSKEDLLQQSEILTEYQSVINDYEDTAAKIASGDSAQIEEVNSQVPRTMAISADATVDELRTQAELAEENMNNITEQFNNHTEGVTEGMVTTAQESYAAAKEALVTALRETMLGDVVGDDTESADSLTSLGFDMGKSMMDSTNLAILDGIQVVRDSTSGAITQFKSSATGEVINATPELIQTFKDLGINCNTSMEGGLLVESLTAPDVQNIDANTWTAENFKNIQANFNKPENTIKIRAVADIVYENNNRKYPSISVAVAPQYFGHYANGGFVDKEQLSWIAEGDKPEVVIPLDPGKRTRAMQLFAQTSELLGVSVQARNGFPLGDSLSPSTSVVDYSRLAALITDSLKSSAIQCNPVFQVSQGDVYLDSEKAGRALTPVISRIQAKTAKFETR